MFLLFICLIWCDCLNLVKWLRGGVGWGCERGEDLKIFVFCLFLR